MIQLSSRLARSIVSGEKIAIRADRDEERAEEHHLGRQKNPHAEGGRLALVRQGGVLLFEPVPREERVIEEGLLLGLGEERISKAHSGLFPCRIRRGRERRSA